MSTTLIMRPSARERTGPFHPGFGAAQSSMELPLDPSKRRVLVEIQRGGSGVDPAQVHGGNLYEEAAKYDPTIRTKGSGGN